MRGVYRDVGCGILGPKKCGMWDFQASEMRDVCFQGSGRGIFWQNKCGMWDFLAKNMWDFLSKNKWDVGF